MRTVNHWIDGKTVESRDGSVFEVSDPMTREPSTAVRLGTTDDVGVAVAAAQSAWPSWAELPAVDRGRTLESLGRLVRAHLDELVALEIADTGKLENNARLEVEGTADYFEYYGGIVRSFFGEVINLGADQHVFTQHEPFGVIAIITPWNSPILQAGRSVAPALATGNAVVVKPSPYTSSSTVRLAQLASDAGVPHGLFNVVLGGGEPVGTALVRHPGVGKIAFTGSVVTGREVASIAAQRLIPVSLELGGKSPNVVFADADLESVAKAATIYLRNCGQVCSALTRLIVERSAHDEMLDHLVPLVEAFRPGPNLAPLTTERQFEIVTEYFDIARREGARAVTGATTPTDASLVGGRYVEPTVFADVTPEMRIFREEIFGPVLTVTPFDTEEEAIELANDTEYGLASSVWSGDLARGLRVASKIKAGQVLVNGGRHGNETPFGGYKNSGIGREKGFGALSEYTQVKTIIVDIGR